MTETERIRRVREMERRMHELSAAAEGLQTALAAYEASSPCPPRAGGLLQKAPSGRRTSPPTRPVLPADLCRSVLTDGRAV